METHSSTLAWKIPWTEEPNQLQSMGLKVSDTTKQLSSIQSLKCAWLFAAPWSVACQAALSMEFSRQEYWSGFPFPTPGDLPDPEIKLNISVPPELAGGLCNTVLPIIREMQSKTTMRNCISYTLKWLWKKIKKLQCRWGSGEIEMLVHWWCTVEWYSHRVIQKFQSLEEIVVHSYR